MTHHTTKKADTTAAGLVTEADRQGRSPSAALVAATVMVLPVLGLLPGAALAQTEPTEPDPAATAPTDGGTAGDEADHEGHKGDIKMPGIRVGDGCVKVGALKVGDCTGSKDKDPPDDPTADPLAPDRYGSTSPEAGQDQYPEGGPYPEGADPLSYPTMEQCDVLYPIGGTTIPQEETALPQEKTALEETAPDESQASAESAPENESTAEENPAKPTGATSPETDEVPEETTTLGEATPDEDAAPEEKTSAEETAPEEEAAPQGGTTSGTAEPTEEQCRQMRESNEATPQDPEPPPSAGDPEPPTPEAADPTGKPEEPQEEPAPETTTLDEPAVEPDAAEPSPESTTDQYPAPEAPAPEQPDPTPQAAEPETVPEEQTTPEATAPEAIAPEATNPGDPAKGETAPEDAPEAPAASVPSEDVCPGAKPVETSAGGPGNQYTAPFEITGDSFLLSYQATLADPADKEGTLVMDLVETEGGTTVETVRARGEEPEQTPIEVGPGTYTVNVYSDNRNYEVTAYDCAGQVVPAGEPAPPAPEDKAPEETTAPAPDDNLGIPAPEATLAAAPEDGAEPKPEAGFELPAAPGEETVPDAQREDAPPQEKPVARPEAEPAAPETAPAAERTNAEMQPAALRKPQSNATARPMSLPTRQTQKGAVAVLPETGGEPASALALTGAAPMERAERVANLFKPFAAVYLLSVLVLGAATRRKHKAAGASTPLTGPPHRFVLNFRPLHLGLAATGLAFLPDGIEALGLAPQAAIAVFSVASFGVLGLLLLGHRHAAPESADDGGAAPSEGQSG